MIKKFFENNKKKLLIIFLLFFFIFILSFFIPFLEIGSVSYNISSFKKEMKEKLIEEKKEEPKYLPLDKELYDKKIIELANNPILPPLEPKYNEKGEHIPEEVKKTLWPVAGLPYPKDGALLPFNRIIAYYGNLYSKKMGVLGEYPKEEMFIKLKKEVDSWNNADPNTKAIPALHYIAIVAQGDSGKDGKYRARMPYGEIDKVIAMAEEIDAIVFLDIQVALSDIYNELPYLEKYLKMPNVHLGIDPEFYMRDGKKPGKYMGTMDAKEINFAIDYLAKIVNENNLYPKILVIHRFTERMVTNYKGIKKVPEVQFVMHMDGWGGKAHKITTYKSFIYKYPVEFTGFKIFYKNDVKEKDSVIFTPEELLKLNPRPIYIQYQ